MHRKTCPGCTGMFVALRSDAETCSPRCRQIVSRRHRKRVKELQELRRAEVEKRTMPGEIVDPERFYEVGGNV